MLLAGNWRIFGIKRHELAWLRQRASFAGINDWLEEVHDSIWSSSGTGGCRLLVQPSSQSWKKMIIFSLAYWPPTWDFQFVTQCLDTVFQNYPPLAYINDDPLSRQMDIMFLDKPVSTHITTKSLSLNSVHYGADHPLLSPSYGTTYLTVQQQITKLIQLSPSNHIISLHFHKSAWCDSVSTWDYCCLLCECTILKCFPLCLIQKAI